MTLSNLLKKHGEIPVVLASANSYSASKQPSTLKTYLQNHLAPQTLEARANETWYLFGDTANAEVCSEYDIASVCLVSAYCFVTKACGWPSSACTFSADHK
jgi:hypothetical protein